VIDLVSEVGLTIDEEAATIIVLQAGKHLALTRPATDVFRTVVETFQVVLEEHLPRLLITKLRRVFALAMRESVLRKSPMTSWTFEELARVVCPHESIILSTIHGAKGLEFDGVLFLGFEAGAIPFSRAVDRDEELRKAYVTVTRSSNLLMYGFRRYRASSFLKRAMGET
jgi:superfamily I DNA/RNA helicase